MTEEQRQEADEWALDNIRDRVGTFYIGDDMLLECMDAVRCLMGKVIVIRCEHRYIKGFEYTAMSPLFQTVQEGCVPLNYTFWFERNNERAGSAEIGGSYIKLFLPERKEPDPEMNEESDG